jgi:ATP-binding cassette subfamily B protein
VWAGSKHVDAGNLEVGDMIAFITYAMMIVMAFMMITMISIFLPRAGVAAERINEVLNTESSINDADNPYAADNADIRGEISFENVSFRYPGAQEDMLHDVSFTAEAHKTTAIIGSTGSGKSTLINLIPRFYDVTEGRILLDGTDIRDITQKQLRDTIGFVPQKGILFSGTIESNLKYADENISDEMMKKAAETAQAVEFIDAKPEGYKSSISQNGSNVSGGQRQRLAIARAVAKQPKIYLFDDSFSALDFKTDAALRRALAENTGNATNIIVAQRISTIMHADKIIVLDEGRVAGIGTHDELMKECEEYREIAKSQLSQAELEGGVM